MSQFPTDPIRDALDHIMRTARNSIQPTRRLDWIAKRAQFALDGKPWSRDVMDEPRNRIREQERLRERLRAAEALADERLQRLVSYGNQLQIVRDSAERMGISEDLDASEYLREYVRRAEAGKRD